MQGSVSKQHAIPIATHADAHQVPTNPEARKRSDAAGKCVLNLAELSTIDC